MPIEQSAIQQTEIFKINEIIVGMGELEIGYEGDLLVCLGLGSCVGVILYDTEKKIACLAHIMLSTSNEVKYARALPERKALIADSDHMVRDSIRRILLTHQYEIEEAKEKNEALHYYRKLKPSISLISAFLPPTDGIEVVHSLLSVDNQVNAIILSPHIDKRIIYNYIINGAKEVILDPFTERKVTSSIDYVLKKNLLKFADIAIPIMMDRMINRGANKCNIVAKIAGGAHMFTSIMDERVMNIGKKNVEVVRKILHDSEIAIMAQDVEKDMGRTIRFDVSTGKMHVKTKDGIKEV